MTKKLRTSVVPVFILLCVLLGGSTQGVWTNAALQLLAIAMIAWAFVANRRDDISRSSGHLMVLVAFLLALFALQLLPLPPAIWSALPGRQVIADGYRLLGLEAPWLPLTITPYETLATVLTLLPPLAVIAFILRVDVRERWIAHAVVAATLAAILLGALQIAGGSDNGSAWYLYDITNNGAVGFFANVNHMGTLLLVAIPFLAALVASRRPGGRGRGAGVMALGIGALLLLIAGIALNGSLAAVGLALPVLAASTLLLDGRSHWRLAAMGVGAVTLLLAILIYSGSPLYSELLNLRGSVWLDTRQLMWSQSVDVAAAFFPFGSGFGSFAQAYGLLENPLAIDRTYVNHAHNDYLEVLVEGSVAGVALLLIFLIWWVMRAIDVWRAPASSSYAKAAIIASATILVHSLVDYPLRTAAIAAIFAACLALISDPARNRASSRSGAGTTARHLRIA